MLEKTNSRDRFTGTFRTSYRPLTWLTAEANMGYDEANSNYKWFTPLGFLPSPGAASRGQLIDTSFHIRSYNTGATIKRREDTHRMAEANRAFSHYRW